MKKKRKFDYRHILCLLITLGFIACTVFLFPKAIYRLIESFRDFGLSFAYYYLELFEIEHKIIPTVNELMKEPTVPVILLPETWENFKEILPKYWELWATKENFIRYLIYISEKLEVFAQVLMIILPFIMGLFFLIKSTFERPNNNDNKDTKPLKIFKKIVKYTYSPINKWLISFYNFIKNHRAYYLSWLGIWMLNFNVATIIIEFIAFYLYFIISFEFSTIYFQIYKLIIDLSAPLTFIPLWVWFIVAIIIRNYLRRKIGYNRLNHNEMCNRGFINERPLVNLIVATMGGGKTMTLTDMSLSQEDMFRDKAKEMMLNCDMKFPNFPWINLERSLKYAIDNHIIYNLATTKQYIAFLRSKWKQSKDWDKPCKKALARKLRKELGIKGGNLIFDYDYKKYGLYHNDKLKLTYVWKVIESYTQLYFIYTIQSSLMISNYSIRTEGILTSKGNFPLWDNDFFKADSRDIEWRSRYAHILDFDSLRLGRKVLEDNPYKDSFEFGVVGITEYGKERLNTLELQEKKKKDEQTNQKNDFFAYTLKLIRHSATVDNFPFVRLIGDEQRMMSLIADERQLCDILHIHESSDELLAMPFFNVEELLQAWVFNKFTNLYDKYRYNRSDNTLIMYLLKGITSRLNNYYNGVYNTFGYKISYIQVENGAQEGLLVEKKYFLSNKKAKSERYSTDCFSEFFAQKNSRSPVGLNDLPEYAGIKATTQEMQSQHSYFFDDIYKHFEDNKKDEE